MRVLLLSLSLLAVPIALAPTAAAQTMYCWAAFNGNVCCIAPNPIGNPGSVPYVVTEAAGNVWLASCGTADRAIVLSLYLIDCVVFNRC